MNPPDPQLAEAAGLRYLLSPPGRRDRADGRAPVLCFLHGYDEGPPTPPRDGLTRHGPLRAGSVTAGADRFIVVAPHLPARGDLWGRYADAVRALVEEVQRVHGGDPARTFLTGFSFGGNGVFDLALASPAFWAALWAVDPTRVPASDPGVPVWLSSGEISRRRERGFIERLGLEPPGAAPGQRVYTDDGRDHVGTATLAYRDARVYDWLLSQP